MSEVFATGSGVGLAISEFKASCDDEISLTLGDELEIIGFNGSYTSFNCTDLEADGWWLAKKGGDIGCVPARCVSTQTSTKRKAAYAASFNKEPIFSVLGPKLAEYATSCLPRSSSSSFSSSSSSATSTTSTNSNDLFILEIASGTGEHANYIGTNLSLQSDVNLYYVPIEPDAIMHESISTWTGDVKRSNVKFSTPIGMAISLDMEIPVYSERPLAMIGDKAIALVDVVICINMTHISHISCTEALFRFSESIIKQGGLIYLYGPYRVNGFMVESNERFDQSLKKRNPDWGIRDLEYVQEIGLKYGFQLQETVQMPVNNLSVIFRKT